MEKSTGKLSLYKVILSIASGWIAILLSQYPLVIDNIYDTQFSWFLLFPMLTTSAFGFPYVYITGIFGLVVILPFLQYPQWGIANLLFSVLYLILLHLCGKTVQKRKFEQYYILFLIYSLAFYWIIVTFFMTILEWNGPVAGLIRFASPMVVRIQTITTVFGVFALASVVKVLLELPVLRRVLKMPQLLYSQKNTKLFCIGIMIAATFLIVDGLFESFYFKSRGVHTFLFFSSFGSLVKFPIVLATGCIICDAIINNTMNNLRAQDKLMKSEERYRMIFQHMTDACFEIDKAGVILNYNPAVKYLGISRQDIDSYTLPRLFGEEKKIEDLVEHLFRINHIENIEMSSVMSDGKERRLLISGNVMEYEEQQLAVLTVRDITDYKKAEEMRWELSAVLNAIFESNKDFIWTVDANTFRMLSFNQAFRLYIWHNSGKKVCADCSMSDIFSDKEAEYFENHYRQVLKTGDISAEYTNENGETLDLSLYPVKLNDRIVSIVVLTKDVTAQKKAEREIAELNAGLEQTVEERTKSLNMAYKDLESFSYTLIHELKTPIREIDTYLEIIKEDNFDILIEQSKEDIMSAQKVCVRTLDMIEKMMIYTRAGFVILNIEKIDFRQLVENCFNSLRQANSNKNIELHISELPCLYADSFLMQVAVMNILSNSIKFSMSKEKIVLKVIYQYSNDKLMYIFKDNGVGFEKDSAAKLFTLFYRAHNNSEYDGNGVGLALVRRIIERHGGNVTISGKPDEGCTVSVMFSRENETRELR